MRPGLLLIVAFTGFATAQSERNKSKPRPAPEMRRLAKMLVGTWKVDEDWAPGGSKPGGKGTARSVIKPGPGVFL